MPQNFKHNVRDLFAFYTDQSWLKCADIWPKSGVLHEDHTFGHITCEADSGQFIVQYDATCLGITPQNATFSVNPGNLSFAYAAERLGLPFLRLLRGATMFHASAAQIDDNGVVFLAPSGVGKSTLLATLLNRSKIRLLAEDITSLSVPKPNSPSYILPISTQIAMRHSLCDASAWIESIDSHGPKRLLTCKAPKISSHPVPLRLFILLEPQSSPQWTPLSFAEALPRLLSQRMTLSNPGAAYERFAFDHLMALQNVPCAMLGVHFKELASITLCADFLIEKLKTLF